MNHPIRLVTFDLDDTLWDIAPVVAHAEQRLYEWLQQEAPQLTQRYTVADLQQLKVELLATTPGLEHQISQLRISALELALQHSGYATGESAELARRGFEVFLHARHEVTYFESALETLAELSQHYTIGALTNGNADVGRLELARYFDFGLAAEQFNAAKPAPDLFLAALERTGLHAAAMVHVGDHVENDIGAALRLGIRAIWVNFARNDWPGGPPPTATIHHLSELPEVLQQLQNTI